jgi:hypothetical protein
MFLQKLGLFAIINLVITGVCMSEIDDLIDGLESDLVALRVDVQTTIDRLTADYNSAVTCERDRIVELQDKISSLRSERLAQVRESCRSSRREAVETLRAEFGDSEFVRFYEKAPI